MAAEPTLNDFRLEPAVSARNWEDGKYDRAFEHHFLDFMIEGRSLRDLVGEPDMVTPLSRPWLEGIPAEIDRLLGRRETEELSAGRVALLLCRVDGDIACGALTARLEHSEAHVAWTDWLWESYQGALPVERPAAPLVFDRTTYEAQLHSALALVQAMPYDELAHRGKRFLWPWEWGWRLPPRVD
jgi:hypothetical protein